MCNADQERLFNSIRLVRGKGDRRKGELCIMSLVALLAGEGHTDAPAAASPLIRHFAIAMNDGLPDDERERLKLFAPRLLGTADFDDPQRALLLCQIFSEEIVPRVQAMGEDAWLPVVPEHAWIGHAMEGTSTPLEWAQCVSERTYGARWRSRRDVYELGSLAALAGTTLIQLSRRARAMEDRAWFRAKGIDVLDRLCADSDVRLSLPQELLRAAQGKLRRPNRLGLFAAGVRQQLQALRRYMTSGRNTPDVTSAKKVREQITTSSTAN